MFDRPKGFGLALLLAALACSEPGTGKDVGPGRLEEGLSTDESSDGGTGSEGPTLDLEGGPGEGQGCTKVDLLFVIDSSYSMSSEQGVLIASFPEFIEGVYSTLGTVDSYHIGVITTDVDGYGFNEEGCREPGALVTQTGGEYSSDAVCGPFLAGRFMTEDDELEDDFACAARVGIEGSNDERPIAAMFAALDGSHAQGCNLGFRREDALLVVVLITDEEDDHTVVLDEEHGSPGDPADWFAQAEALVQDESRMALLSICGGEPVNQCGLPAGVGAEDAPRLREFTEMFSHGFTGDVCAWSYTPVFEAAIAVVEDACAEFVPVP